MRTKRSTDSGAALLVTLFFLALMTIIAVAFLGTMTNETASARNNYENQKARAIATYGMNTAVAQIRGALDTWDSPYKNFATNPPAFYWSMSPGMITRWSYASVSAASVTNYPLFSVSATNLVNSYPVGDGTYAVTTNMVNLNAPGSDGSYPIVGITNTIVSGATPPNISVYWVNVLNNPANSTASAANPIVGRYAYWVDDENAKININTADGTMKYQTNSLGLGSPSEVSLQVLQSNTNALSPATNIVYLARTTGLNSPREILRAGGTTPDLYTNNVFNITTYSRSPDLNVFGQPKMVLTPILGDSAKFTNDMAMNSMTLQPSREIYPTPSQLPKYGTIVVPSRIGTTGQFYWHPPTPNTTNTWEPYPLALRGSSAFSSTGVQQPLDPNDQNQIETTANYPWINGMLLAQYLAGTNAAYKPVAWPALPGSSTSGFSGKYTSRQIDSIVAQIISLGAKTISPDIAYATHQDIYIAGNPPVAAAFWSRGLSTTVPFLFFGWISNEWVSGMGRSPKVSAIELEFATKGPPPLTPPTDTKNYYPTFGLDAWQEWWLPAAYLGGRNDLPIGSTTGVMYLGTGADQRVLNMTDLSQNYLVSPYSGAALPKPDGSLSWWGNQLLTNDQGIDFQCNPATNATPIADPDQTMAAAYHNPFALEADNVTYAGTGRKPAGGIPLWTPFSMTQMQTNGCPIDWQPGELRTVRSQFGPTVLNPGLPMRVGAIGSTLNISGGVQVLSVDVNINGPSQCDPVPLEAIRGTGNTNLAPGTGPNSMTGELWTDPGSPLNPSMSLRTRFTNEVIPIQISMPVPAATDPPQPNTEYVLIKVADPLVNKFPGDWTAAGGAMVIMTNNSPPSATPGYWASAGTTDAQVARINENNATSGLSGGTFHGALADQDSYWLPQADVPLCFTNDVASETIIPRSARCPNIGYLQYIRTGIMPDVPTPLTPRLEHGTPFRLLSYAPITTDAAHQKTTASGSLAYPDWAMLDLLYIPTTLAPFGGPYGYYDVNGVWQPQGAYGNNASILASYSTGGGSTPGRINPNGAVIYTTNLTTPQPGIARTVPLQALVHGLMVNQTLPSTATSLNPFPTGGTSVDDSISEADPNSIPVAIEAYIRANGPLRLPGELCNVSAIAALRAPVNATRNDLIRQIIGNVTTQSNTFSVWVAGESILKTKNNTNYGIYESGDQVSASVRYHFIVERYLDPGADGVYGNSISAGNDGVMGTYDDPVDPVNHPFQPRYLYRVVAAEEIR